MKKINVQLYSIIGIFLISSLFVTILYQKSQLDYQSHQQHIDIIRNIQENTSQLTHNLRLIKIGKTLHYDDIVNTTQLIETLINQLSTQPSSTNLVKTWELFKQQVEVIKSNNAIYKNSLLHFSKGINYLIKPYVNKPQYQLFIIHLFNLERHILSFNITHNNPPELTIHIKAFKSHLNQLHKPDIFLAKMLLEHADILSNHSFHQDELYIDSLKTNIYKYSQELRHQYNNQFQQKIIQTNQIKKIFYISCLILILVIIISLRKLKTTVFKLQKSEQILRQVSDNAPIMLWMSNKKGYLDFSNDRWQNQTTKKTKQNIFSPEHFAHIHPDDRKVLKQAYSDQTNKSTVSTIQYRTIDPATQKTQATFLTHIIARYSKLNTYHGLICSTIDISEQKKLEEELNLAANVFKYSVEGILISDAQNKIVQVNQAFTELTGYSKQEVLGNMPTMLSSGLQSKTFYTTMWDDIHENGVWRGEILNRRKNGQVYPEWLTIIALKNSDDALTHHIAIFRDITEKKRAEQDIHFLAHFDALTRLPNRALFYQRAESAMQQTNHCVAILFLDLDRFKAVNDALGHDAGDQLLVAIANDLKSAVRDIDLVARIGGDEFTIILEGLSPNSVYKDAKKVADKIIHLLSSEYLIKNSQVFIGVSIGISIYPQDTKNLDSMLQYADMAMYHAKEEGRNNAQFYTQKLSEIVQNKLKLEADLRLALDQNQLFLHYQPQYNLATQKIEGFEALVRWNHPSKGLVQPDEFISIAEESGLILDIGEWVLKTACLQLKKWHQQFSPALRMAVNVSVKQLERKGFIEHVIMILEQSAINPSALEIEVTESIFLEEDSITHKLLGQLDQLGVQISMDDFGTGYSNMAYLKKLPIDRIKIDRCFIADILDDESDAAITCAIIDIARHFQIKVIAEGIEHQNQADYLLSKGCDEGQGYLFSKPVTVTDIEIKLNQKNAY